MRTEQEKLEEIQAEIDARMGKLPRCEFTVLLKLPDYLEGKLTYDNVVWKVYAASASGAWTRAQEEVFDWLKDCYGVEDKDDILVLGAIRGFVNMERP